MSGPQFPTVSPWARKAYGDSGLWNGELLDEQLARQSATAPDRLALVDGPTRLTYGVLHERVRSVAAGLAELGVGRGDVVTMQLPNWWEAMVVHFAVVSIGAVCNPVVPILRDRELGFVVDRGHAKVVVAAAEFRGYDHGALALRVAAAAPSVQHVVTVRGRRDGALALDDLLATAPARPAAGTRDADDPVVLLYTSGTEADPKGAVHSHQTLGYENRTIAELFSLTADDVVWAPSPVGHVTGVLFAFHLAPMLGATVVFQDVWDAGVALRLIQDETCSFTVAATPFLHGITHHSSLADFDTSSLRVFVCGGADVPPALIRAAGERLGVAAVRLYGSTEIPTVTSGSDHEPLHRRAGTDGRAIAQAQLRVVREDGCSAPTGEVGRLLARGPEAMLGYLGADPQPFDDQGWFDTGDLGRLDADGYLQVAGRSKDIIVRGGENISAKEVEDLLVEHPAVADVAVVAVPDPRLAERACAVVVLHAGASLDLAGIVAFLDERSLARQKYPERLEIVAELPKTPTGKVQKFALRELVAQRLS